MRAWELDPELVNVEVAYYPSWLLENFHCKGFIKDQRTVLCTEANVQDRHNSTSPGMTWKSWSMGASPKWHATTSWIRGHIAITRSLVRARSRFLGRLPPPTRATKPGIHAVRFSPCSGDVPR